MKAVYERPRVSVESFAPNCAVAAACGYEQGKTFFCLVGPTTDTSTVLSEAIFVGSKCKNQASYYAGVNTAISTNNRGGNPLGQDKDPDDAIVMTNNAGGNDYSKGTTLTATGAVGMLTYVTGGSWTQSGTSITYAGNSQHVQVLPVFGTPSEVNEAS